MCSKGVQMIFLLFLTNIIRIDVISYCGYDVGFFGDLYVDFLGLGCHGRVERIAKFRTGNNCWCNHQMYDHMFIFFLFLTKVLVPILL